MEVLNFFLVQKLIFGHFWNYKKWNLVKNYFHEIDLFDFTSFFAIDFFNILAYCVCLSGNFLLLFFQWNGPKGAPAEWRKNLKNIIYCNIFPFLAHCELYTKKEKNRRIVKSRLGSFGPRGIGSRMWFLRENWWRGVPVPILIFQNSEMINGLEYKFEKAFDHVIQSRQKKVCNWETKMNNCNW